MDDLSGLNWSSTTSAQNKNQQQMSSQPPASSNSNYSNSLYQQALRPTPSPLGSGRNTPLSTSSSGGIPSKPPAQKAPVQDHFSNLVNFGSSSAAKTNTANLSLREQQERLEAEKRRKQEEKQSKLNAQFGNGQFWDKLHQNPASRTASPGPQKAAEKIDDDADLFAAFNADTKVDNSSHYPPPPTSKPASGKATPSNAGLDLGHPSAWSQPTASVGGGGDFGGLGNNDDDPFGLGKMNRTKQAPIPVSTTVDDDDFLGDLAKPIEEVRKMQAAQKRPTSRPEPGKPIEDVDSDSSDDGGNVDDLDPFDKAVSQLVDLGFTPENARKGLTESGAGLDVQAAAGWLLDDAERQAKAKSRAKAGGSSQAQDRGRGGGGAAGQAAWMQDGGRQQGSEPDLSTTAAAMGASFLKGANSLWKTGQKKVQKAVADLHQEGATDPNQPKWMRDTQQQGGHASSGPRKAARDVTDEAMMLESGMRPGRKPSRPTGEPSSHAPQQPSREGSPFGQTAPTGKSSAAPVLRWQHQAPTNPAAHLDPKSRLSKLTQDDGAPAYVSPARRKKMSPAPPPSQQPKPPLPAEEPDLLNGGMSLPTRPKSAVSQRSVQSSTAPRPSTQPPSRVVTPRPTPPPRRVPPINQTALQNSHKHRAEGTTHFKRGDYAAAHISYTKSLSEVPRTHPLAILLFTNRALTALKTGEPRQAIDDADGALKIIGPAGGVRETVAVENGETRDMRDLFSKALSRKAEALEQLEKWAEAGTIWQLAVEAGVGGAAAITGKQRCQKALAPKPKVTPQASRSSTPAARPKPKPSSAMADLGPPGKESEAVERLRAANKAAEKADDEKFALSDKVDARIAGWRDGKRDNLRALLGSLENVLWEGSGWKKVGMHELVMQNKVKIVYMRAIAKCHPDKLAQDANTEVRLISGTVFATLNEAWDKFKAENGM